MVYMKKTAILAALVLFTGTAAGVVGYDGPQDQPHIMGSSSSASATASVGPNGTEFHSTVKMEGRSPQISEDNVSAVNYSEDKLSFEGSIQAPTPCHTIDQETEEKGNQSYTINIVTTQEDSSEVCTQQRVMINYKGSFEKERPLDVTIKHEGKTVETFHNPPAETDEISNPVKRVMDWFENLF